MKLIYCRHCRKMRLHEQWTLKTTKKKFNICHKCDKVRDLVFPKIIKGDA